jgi:hypothetical protein
VTGRARRRVLAVLGTALSLALLLSRGSSRADMPETEVRGGGAATLPTGSGTPVRVRVGVQFVDLEGVDENEETFGATVDVRLRWKGEPGDPLEVVGAAADAALADRWAPHVDLANLVGEPAFRERGLVVAASGETELLERTTGTFAAHLDERDFPFDHQALPVEVVVRDDDLDQVSLEFHGDDVAYSRADPEVEVRGWDVGLVDLRSRPIAGWHHRAHARVIASLLVERQWSTVMAPVFIPLFSSMLIPLIAIWLQKVSDDGEFEVDAFELANIVIGGLFAVIALNFTVNSEYATLASGDNTLSRLFALNYSTLAAAMVVDIGMFQFHFVGRWFGRFVEEQAYFALSWGIPVASLGTAVAVLLVAWA